VEGKRGLRIFISENSPLLRVPSGPENRCEPRREGREGLYLVNLKIVTREKERAFPRTGRGAERSTGKRGKNEKVTTGTKGGGSVAHSAMERAGMCRGSEYW